MANRESSVTAAGLLTACLLALVAACGTTGTETPETAVVPYGYRVVATYPHDRQAFTQGLVYEDGLLYESTGLYGQSALIKRDLKTGRALKTVHLIRRHFGEGIAIVPDSSQAAGGDRIVQLTWRNKTGFVYRKDTFTLLKEFTYPTEGWGITYDGTRLIYSDGTATLRFLDPNSLTETGRIEVRDEGRPVRGLNELEFIPDRGAGDEAGEGTEPGEKGQGTNDEAGGGRLETGGAYSLQPTISGLIFANVWPTDRIVAIDPKTGRVTGRLDLPGLYPRPRNSEDVLNGIAWIPETGHLLVTGKLWPKVYEIELLPELPQEQRR